jgi:hypothetical protein
MRSASQAGIARQIFGSKNEVLSANLLTQLQYGVSLFFICVERIIDVKLQISFFFVDRRDVVTLGKESPNQSECVIRHAMYDFPSVQSTCRLTNQVKDSVVGGVAENVVPLIIRYCVYEQQDGLV